MSSSKHIPFRIHWRLQGRMVAPLHPIHLDALLAWSRVQEAIQQDDTDPYAAQDDLPLAKAKKNGLWVWKASQLMFMGNNSGMSSMTRRTHVHEIAKLQSFGILKYRRAIVDTGSGPLKSALSFQHERDVSDAFAYVVGDPDAVRGLLERVTHIGKRRRLGFGKVLSFEIIPDDNAINLWKARMMPWPADDNCYPVMGRCHPPYWRQPYETCYFSSELL